MYLKQTCNIEISGKYRLRGLHSCEIKRSVHQIVQSAKIQLPLSVLFRNNDLLERIKLIDKIKEGDPITIDLGYDGKNRREFSGFIKRINTVNPLEIECEDELYLLRKCYFKKNFKKADIREILELLLKELFEKSGVRLELYDKMPKLTVTNFMIDGANGVAVLQDLFDKYGLASYVVNIDGIKTLYCGLIYGLKKANVKYELQRNTINVNELKYQVSDTKSYQIKVVNHSPAGLVREVSVGDKNGEQRTVHFYGNENDTELKQMGSAQISSFNAEGYRGSFETFLLPNVEPTDIANITEKQFGRKGNYYVGTVTTTFGNGARRKIELDIVL